MRHVLFLQTRPTDPLLERVVAQSGIPEDTKTERIDLTKEEPDYPALVQKIFEADSVQVW